MNEARGLGSSDTYEHESPNTQSSRLDVISIK